MADTGPEQETCEKVLGNQRDGETATSESALAYCINSDAQFFVDVVNKTNDRLPKQRRAQW